MKDFIKNINEEKGLAMTEFALILPFLAVLIMGIVESGRMIHQQLMLYQATNSASRFAIGLSSLTQGPYRTEIGMSGINCNGGQIININSSHQPIHEKLQELVEISKVATKNNFCLKTFLSEIPSVSNPNTLKTSPIATTPTNKNSRLITVTASAEYEPLFIPYEGIILSASSTAPYIN